MSQGTGPRWLAASVATAAAVVSMGCGSTGSNQASTPTPASRSGHATVHIVALGDSDATGIGDSTGRGWVGRYGELAKRKLNAPVTVDNRAIEGQTSDQLRTSIAGDNSLQHTLSTADIVLVGIGGADLNAGDDALSAGQCKGWRCYAPILRRFRQNLDAIATEIRRLAPGALLRAMSLPNGFPGAGSAFPPFATARLSRFQAKAERAAVCHAMQANNGRCIDVIRAFNGANANGDAYARGLMTKDPCCYPSAKGQQLIAHLLIATGLVGVHGTQ